MFSSYIYPRGAHLMNTLLCFLEANMFCFLIEEALTKHELLDILRYKNPFPFLHQLLIPY